MTHRTGRRAPGFLASCLVATSCGPGGDDPTRTVTVGDSAGIPVYELREVPAWDDPRFLLELELERSITTGSPDPTVPPLLYNPQGFALLADGTLIVHDAGDARLAVIPPDRDTVVARFGRFGQGPGEIGTVNALLWPAEGRSFWVLDSGNSRLSRFSLAGELLDEARVEFVGAGGYGVQRPISHEPFFWRVFRTSIRGPGARLSDSVVRFDAATGRTEPVAPMPPRHPLRALNTSPLALFAPSPTFAPVGSGGVVVARTDIPRFLHYSDDGSLLGIIVLPLEPRPIPSATKPVLLREAAEAFPPAAYASVDDMADQFELWSLMWPVGDSLFALEHIRQHAPDGDPPIPPDVRVWRLLSVRGRYAGVVRLPDGFGYPYWFGRDRIVGVRRDSLGVATIQIYRLPIPR